jgi:ABC-2 type transport system permease protein
MMSPRRTIAIARKEVLHIIRDPRNLFLVTISPAFLLFLLSYIFTFEISHLDLAALDLDRTPISRSYLADLTSDGDLILAYTVDRYEQISPLLLSDAVDAAIVIPPRFADMVYGGRPAQVQAIIDGTDPFAGSQAINAISARSAAFVAKFNDTALPYGAQPLQMSTQAWYNAGLQSLLSMVPGLLAIVLVMPTMALALALTREKETGTLEGLLATPVSPLEYLTGKLLAYVFTGLVSATLALLVAVLWFRVPYRGSLAIYFLLAADYFLACMGATVVVAHYVRSQQTSMFVVLLVFIVPSFFLAGLIDPISGDSLTAILTSYSLPSTHFVEISRVLFLKGLGLVYVARPALVLLAMGIGALGLGLALFKKKLA